MSEIEIGTWQRGPIAAQAAAIAALFDRLRAADGRAPESPPGPDANVLLAHRRTADGDTVVALAYHEGTDPAELYVDPAHRRRGIGRALAEATLSARGDTPPAGIWAHGTSPAATHLARSLDLVPARELLQLRRDVTDLAATPLPVDLPPGVAVRTFRPGADDAAFLAVNARAFAWHPEQGRLDAAGLRAEMAESWFDPDGFFLAVQVTDAAADTVLGFHWTKIHREEQPPLGEVYVLGVDPLSPVKHLGTPLTAIGLNYLAARGMPAVLLYVEADNERAVALYRRFGFTDYATDTVFARPDR